MSMKGGHKLNEEITIKDPNDPIDSEKHFHPYTKESMWGYTDYGFFVGLGPLPERGNRRFQDFFCALNTDGNIYKIEKYDTGVFARPADDKIKEYLDGFNTKITYSDYANKSPLTTLAPHTRTYTNTLPSLDKMLNNGKRKPDEYYDKYYIYSFDFNPNVNLLTHKLQKIKVDGGKRKTRRVKKSNRKSNRKRRSNTKRHTRKH